MMRSRLTLHSASIAFAGILLLVWILVLSGPSSGARYSTALLFVIASLVYLATQIRHSQEQMSENTRNVRIASEHSRAQQRLDQSAMIAQSPELNRIFWAGLQDPESLSDVECRHFESIFAAFMGPFQSTFNLNRVGVLSPTEWEGQAAALEMGGHPAGLQAILAELEIPPPSRLRDIDRRSAIGEPRRGFRSAGAATDRATTRPEQLRSPAWICIVARTRDFEILQAQQPVTGFRRQLANVRRSCGRGGHSE